MRFESARQISLTWRDHKEYFIKVIYWWEVCWYFMLNLSATFNENSHWSFPTCLLNIPGQRTLTKNIWCVNNNRTNQTNKKFADLCYTFWDCQVWIFGLEAIFRESLDFGGVDINFNILWTYLRLQSFNMNFMKKNQYVLGW